ncbi:hypothetical protein LAJ19_20130 (plasmid) [Deinococcus taeanensis]|uniref:hypothetical protein n=1 Tax=Deinococcus taeanensis TaxID=2737050 RepID=UPI001CDC2EF2|nr:hypothetical protein [Deinococcus taeanensis]UBV45437.1 hypothetical protein LAJ19_20130 [Deinococcus taeanensis]
MAIRALVNETHMDDRGRPCRFTGGEFPGENRASLTMYFSDGAWCSLEIEASRLDAATLSVLARGWARDPVYRAAFMAAGSHSYVGRALPLPQEPEDDVQDADQEAGDSPDARRAALAAILVLGDAATFEDYAALRSGRDEFSRRKLTLLRADLGDLGDEVAAHGHALGDKALASALRWCARGLPPVMAVRRAAVEVEVERARIELRQARWRR